MTTFGVCRFDPDAYNSKPSNLVRFQTYEEALEYYKMRVLSTEMMGYLIPKDWWLVFMEGDLIVQLEQLSWKVSSKVIDEFEEEKEE